MSDDTRPPPTMGDDEQPSAEMLRRLNGILRDGAGSSRDTAEDLRRRLAEMAADAQQKESE